MKKIISMAFALMISVALSAQSSITTFMGVPVDGTKSNVKKALLSHGVREGDKNLMTCCIDGDTCFVNILTHKGKVYRISAIETKGTPNIAFAVRKYAALVEKYKNDSNYEEYESNDLPRVAGSYDYERWADDDYFYAEFFQKTEPQLYSRIVGFRINNQYGDYRIEHIYENIYTSPDKR